MLKQVFFVARWKEPKEKWVDFYRQGLRDQELVSITGASLRTIKRWRSEHGLPVNDDMRGRTHGIDTSDFMSFYMCGMTDVQIARSKGCSDTVVWRWRHKHNLPPRGRHGFKSNGGYAGQIFKKGHSLNRGEKHWNWHGGLSLLGNNGFYWRKEWKEVRDYVFKRDHYCCLRCGSKGGNLNVHHILSVRNNPELALDPLNLVTLCRSCHLKVEREKLERVVNG